MIGGVLYSPNGIGLVEAFHPGTGKTLWVQEPFPDEGPAGSSRQQRARRCVLGGRQRPAPVRRPRRVPDRARCRDRASRCPAFGEGGPGQPAAGSRPTRHRLCVDRRRPGLPRRRHRRRRHWRLDVGSSRRSRQGVPGVVQAFDVRTGKPRWKFNPIPRPGEVGSETWENDSWSYSGDANLWSLISADEEQGLAYLPMTSPTSDMYGGHRLGDNLFANTLVCVRCATGERVWHYQIVHHDLWDYDLPAAPILADIRVDGKPIKAVVQLTKQAFAFVFDRMTGRPVWPIEERPVPASDVPGERTSRTQPFPTKPPPFDRQGVDRSTISSTSPRSCAPKRSRCSSTTASVRSSRRRRCEAMARTVTAGRSSCPALSEAPTGRAGRSIRRPASCTSSPSRPRSRQTS